jgi:hypothetical protein
LGAGVVAATLALAGAGVARAAIQPDSDPLDAGAALGLVESPAQALRLLLDLPEKRPAPKPPRKKARPQPIGPARVSVSRYEHTTSREVLHDQGCLAGRRDAGGLTILDFGKPSWNGHTHGTILFSNRFASNGHITHALYAFATGYVRCLPRASRARIVLARGTSNYGLALPSPYDAGRAWARETVRLSRLLEAHPGIAAHVQSAAADDIEPAWDRHFGRTRNFVRGFRAAPRRPLLYNFGSLDGGAGGIWTVAQAYYVSSGRNTRVVPEIYSRSMAHQWAELAKVAAHRYHRPVRFAGVLTQHHAHCGCSLRPHAAHQALVHALASHIGEAAPDVPLTLTNLAG